VDHDYDPKSHIRQSNIIFDLGIGDIVAIVIMANFVYPEKSNALKYTVKNQNKNARKPVIILRAFVSHLRD